MEKKFIRPDLFVITFMDEDIITSSNRLYVPYDPEKDDWSDDPDTI